MSKHHRHDNSKCPLNNPETFCNQVISGLGCSCETPAEAAQEFVRPLIESARRALAEHLPDARRGDAENAVRLLLSYLGQNPASDGLRDTPGRVVRALVEMTKGYKDEPKEILGRVFDVSYDQVVILRDIEFTSLCEHHLLVFSGTVDIGYIPGRVVGLSKLARLVDCFAHRLQVQERMTNEIAQAIHEHLEAKGVAVVVRAQHSCMACRGVRKPGAEMVTSAMLGLFRSEAAARAEFLSLCRG